MLMVCSLPPPVHGQSVVNAAMCRRLSDDATVCDIGPAGRSGPAYHLTRLRRVVAALARVVTARGGAVYFSSEAGWGVLYLLALAAAARLARVREMYLHHHVYGYIHAPGPGHRLLLAVAGPACRHILLSERMEADFRRRFGARHDTLVVHNAPFIDAALRRGPSGAGAAGPAATTTLGFIGRLDDAKGFDVFLALVEAFAADPKVRFVVAGDTATSPLADAVERARTRVGDRLTLMGFVDGPTKTAFFEGIDVLVFPSKYANEASPLVCYEAMAMGVAVLATDVGAVTDLVTEECGAVVGRDTPLVPAFAALLRELVADPARRHRWQVGARARFERLERRADAALTNLRAGVASPPDGRPSAPHRRHSSAAA